MVLESNGQVLPLALTVCHFSVLDLNRKQYSENILFFSEIKCKQQKSLLHFPLTSSFYCVKFSVVIIASPYTVIL